MTTYTRTSTRRKYKNRHYFMGQTTASPCKNYPSDIITLQQGSIASHICGLHGELAACRKACSRVRFDGHSVNCFHSEHSYLMFHAHRAMFRNILSDRHIILTTTGVHLWVYLTHRIFFKLLSFTIFSFYQCNCVFANK